MTVQELQGISSISPHVSMAISQPILFISIDRTRNISSINEIMNDLWCTYVQHFFLDIIILFSESEPITPNSAVSIFKFVTEWCNKRDEMFLYFSKYIQLLVFLQHLWYSFNLTAILSFVTFIFHLYFF